MDTEELIFHANMGREAPRALVLSLQAVASRQGLGQAVMEPLSEGGKEEKELESPVGSPRGVCQGWGVHAGAILQGTGSAPRTSPAPAPVVGCGDQQSREKGELSTPASRCKLSKVSVLALCSGPL